MDIIENFDAWRERRHHPDPTAQETIMTRIAAAKEAADRASAALAGLAGNPLAELLAEHGIGASLTPSQAATAADLTAAYERSVTAQQQQAQDALRAIRERLAVSDEALSAAWLRQVLSDPSAPQAV